MTYFQGQCGPKYSRSWEDKNRKEHTHQICLYQGLSIVSHLRRSILGECEYKYVVRNTDGSIAMWTPGDNFELRLSPEEARGAAVPEKVEISDAWDASWRKVRVGCRNTLHAARIFNPSILGKI